MSKDREKIIRQLSLLTFLLSEKRPRTPREIQESVEGYWDMSDDTFARRFFGDRSDLAKIGIELRVISEGDDGENQLYSLSEEEYRLPSVEFTPAERRALAMALGALDGRFAYARPLRLALTALCQGMPASLEGDLDQLPVALAPDEEALHAGKQLARLEDAIGRSKTVCFKYRSAAGSEEERTVDPYNLLLIQGHWYVVGWDHARSAIRTFRLTRVGGQVRFLTDKAWDFAVSPAYDPGEYRARPPWLLGQPTGTAILEIDDDLAWWVSRLQPHVTILDEGSNGISTYSMPYADESVLLSWVAGSARHARLIGPPALRSRLVQSLIEVERAHSGESDDRRVAPAAGSSPVASRSKAQTKARRRDAEPIAPEHLARAISLMQYLLEEDRPDFVTWQTLESEVGLTRAEAEADISLINLVNFGGGTSVIYAENTADGVRVTRDPMADVFSQPAQLSPLMVRALALAFDLLGDGAAIDSSGSLASARRKIVQLAEGIPAKPPIIVDEVGGPSPAVFELLSMCIQNHGLIEIEYFTPAKGKLTKRRIEPYLLFRTGEGWYLEAFCLLAGEQRTFRLEFIREVTPTGEVFIPRTGADLSSRRAGAPLASNSAQWASVVFAPRWRIYLEDRGISYDKLQDGWLRARLPYFADEWLVREVLRFLGEAVLSEPESVRHHIQEVATGLRDLYST